MKKILLFSMLIVALFLTGCSSNDSKKEGNLIDEPTATPIATPTPTPDPVKRLSCIQTVQGVSVNMLADFNADKLTYLGLKYEMDLSAYTDAQISAINAQDMCSTVKANMSTYSNAFTNCKQSVANKKLLITADFDLNKLTGADLSGSNSIDEAKSELEKQNYKCTITNK